MSMIQTTNIPCPSCGTEVPFDAALSVNGGRHPHLREGILAGSYQQETCPECGALFRLDPELTYVDVGRSQWLLVRPASEVGSWAEMEGMARDTFNRAFGSSAPPPARAMGADLQVRVTFGWAALREKLICAERGLDDVTLELLKVAIVRGLDDPPIDDDVELRLFDIEGDTLSMAWIRADSEAVVESLSVPKAVYDEIAADAEGWAELKADLTAGPFVDMNRLLVESEAAAPTA